MTCGVPTDGFWLRCYEFIDFGFANQLPSPVSIGPAAFSALKIQTNPPMHPTANDTAPNSSETTVPSA
jgi:hypothetical protein